MERRRRTVVQLEEAERLILDGEVARLRLAVILLDNAVEVILHRRVSDTLQSANTYARVLRRFPGGLLDAKGRRCGRRSSGRPDAVREVRLQKERLEASPLDFGRRPMHS